MLNASSVLLPLISSIHDELFTYRMANCAVKNRSVDTKSSLSSSIKRNRWFSAILRPTHVTKAGHFPVPEFFATSTRCRAPTHNFLFKNRSEQTHGLEITTARTSLWWSLWRAVGVAVLALVETLSVTILCGSCFHSCCRCGVGVVVVMVPVVFDLVL
jgi:hypothetical protein